MNPSSQSEASTEATKGLGLGHDDSGASTTPVHQDPFSLSVSLFADP